MDFIGQDNLINSLENSDSRSILVQGPVHWGKKTLLRRFLAERGDVVYEVSGNAQDFRNSLEVMQTRVAPIVYLIPDVDRLNATIQNMLLKVLEEPPMKASFFLTANNSVLPTIKSRCVSFLTEPYRKEELLAYLKDAPIYAEYGDSPGRCQLLRDSLNFSENELPDSIRNLMTFILRNLNGSPAVVLNKANEVGKLIRDAGLDYFLFYLLARRIYEGYESLSILSSHLDVLDRYTMIYFYMSLWKEEQCR